MTTFAHLPLAQIAASLTNPRKTFDAGKLAELAASITASGVHQAVLVRPLPGNRVADTDRGVLYELVTGERRLRACTLANVPTIPAMIRTLTDDQVLEIQIVENLQRDDLTELEEAEGYEALMQHSHLNAEQVGEKIGKSRSYVYGRLKLLDLCQEARTSLRERTIDASRALLVARIPDHKLQIRAMKEILTGGSYSFGGDEPMSYRRAAQHVQRNYMLKLADARFTITAADLVPEAGSCKECPKRTGHNPDLFADVRGADVCTDPPCYHRKEEAHAASLVQAAQAKGQTVIAGKEAAEIAVNAYGAPKFKGYKRLDHIEDSPTSVPLRKIIGAIMKAEGIQPVLIAHPTKAGEMVECLPNEVALRLLKAVEGQAAAAKTVTKEVKALVDEKKAKAEAKAKNQFEQEWRSTLVHDTWCALRDDAEVQAFNVDVHRYLVLRAANSLSTDHAAALCKLLALGKVAPVAAIIDLARETPDPARLHLLIIMQEASSAHDHSYPDHIANKGLMLVAGNVFGAKLQAVIDEIKAECKARIWPEPEKKPAAKATPAAGVDVSHGGKGAKAKKAGAPLRKPKTSAAEAQAQIAAAMQAEDPKTEPGADAQGIEATASGCALAVGARVKILPSATGRKESPWIGKTGTVQGQVGGEAWDVMFTAKVAKPVTGKAVAAWQSFHVTEMEVEEA